MGFCRTCYSHPGLATIRELNSCFFKSTLNCLHIVCQHVRHAVFTFGTADGLGAYLGTLSEFLCAPAEEGAGGADLAAGYQN
jgi:hypothetical protein